MDLVNFYVEDLEVFYEENLYREKHFRCSIEKNPQTFGDDKVEVFSGVDLEIFSEISLVFYVEDLKVFYEENVYREQHLGVSWRRIHKPLEKTKRSPRRLLWRRLGGLLWGRTGVWQASSEVFLWENWRHSEGFQGKKLRVGYE